MPSDAIEPLDDHGLSPTARTTLARDVQNRVADAWQNGRALILNANKPGYSEAFTISAEQYALLRTAILTAVHTLADDRGEVLLKQIQGHVDDTLSSHPAFPNGRMTNYTRYTKTDLEARGEVERVPKRSPQRIRRPAAE